MGFEREDKDETETETIAGNEDVGVDKGVGGRCQSQKSRRGG